jgi:TPR repeat protein
MKALSPRRIWILAVVVVLAAGLFYLCERLQEKALHDLPYGFKKFSLSDPLPTCGRWKEHMPSYREPGAYRLYIEARKLWRSKQAWELTREENARILKDISTAADMGDWGARALMAHFYLNGLGGLDTNNVLDPVPEKAIEIERLAVKAGQPWGFYDLGVAYEYGHGGLPQDKDLAWAYYLRAAELGSPEAQMALASAYAKARRLEDEEKMQLCAFKQGHGPAAYELAMSAQVNGRHAEALMLRQEGVKFGSQRCASSLRLLFDEGTWAASTKKDAKAALSALGVHLDLERSQRYEAISDALKINPDLKLGRLDLVVPLPPKKLPKWNGVKDAVEPDFAGNPAY